MATNKSTNIKKSQSSSVDSDILANEILTFFDIDKRIFFRNEKPKPQLQPQPQANHKCGSLFAKCNCGGDGSLYVNNNKNNSISKFQPLKTDCDTQQNYNKSQDARSSKQQFLSQTPTPTRRSVIDSKLNGRRLFQSFSHPDTSFIFTNENLQPSRRDSLKHTVDTSTRRAYSYNLMAQTEKFELNQSKRSSSLVNPETECLTICQMDAETENPDPNRVSNKTKGSAKESRRLFQRSNEFQSVGSTTETDESDESAYNLSATLMTSPSGASNKHESEQNNFNAAQKFFAESGILGPMNTTNELIRKTSRVLQDPKVIEQIRKTSIVLRTCNRRISTNSRPQFETLQPLTSSSASSKQGQPDFQATINSLQQEITSLKSSLRSRDCEILKLQKELHKLQSVLQKKKPSTLAMNSEVINNIFGQKCNDLSSPDTSSGDQKSVNEFKHSVLKGSKSLEISSNAYSTVRAPKKQGVSAESCDMSVEQAFDDPIPKYIKDFSSKQLIKDALMENDFLKNIDASQVRELVESMYPLRMGKKEFVVREGEVGAHLFVSASGEFEVIQNGKLLDKIGSGKTFGELAILYNCKRTASIRVLTDEAHIWVLDRRVFQQIMMRTGLQRIENSVNFLKSVPLLKNLSEEILVKIADVLEVEFYAAGTYVIRQGASGDTFFLISQGMVKVTQKQTPASEETELRTLSRGDYFGEQALINEDKRTANIIALAPGVECLTLDRESFMHLIGDLCELKEKSYADEKHLLERNFTKSTKSIFCADRKLEFPDMNLSDLELVATLGVGGFGRVELVKAYNKNSVDTFALKCLAKQHIIDTKQQEHVFNERTIMLSCRSPFICRLYRTFRDDKYVYMLLEACMGGEVWTMLRDHGAFNESSAQFIIACVLQAFDYLHSRGIIYRDLKPENLMMDQRGYVKLVDFGFAKYIGNSSKTWTFCGTPEYVAPEIILNKGHDRAVDYWAFGILIHELLNGTPPFSTNDPLKTYNLILKGIDMIVFPKSMSRSAVTLIKKLCRHMPSERLGYQKAGMQDIKKHKWFLGFDWDGLESQQLKPPFERLLAHSMDTCYFDKFSCNSSEPPNEVSGWDIHF